MENGYVAQGVKVFPSDALWIQDPVLFALGVAAGGFALVDQSHFGAVGLVLEDLQFLGRVGLKTQMVQARLAAACRNGKVDAWIVQHPFGVIGLHAGRGR